MADRETENICEERKSNPGGGALIETLQVIVGNWALGLVLGLGFGGERKLRGFRLKTDGGPSY